MTNTTFPARLHSDDALVGTWMTEASAAQHAALGASGVDFVILDCQHSTLDDLDAVRALPSWGEAPPVIVRASRIEETAIGRIADAGAAGVIAPGVTSAGEAERVARALRFPPHGVRSYGPRHPRLGTDPAEIETHTAAIVLIESTEAVAAIDDIAATSGLSALFFGPADFAISAGLPLTAAVDGRLDSTVAACRAACDRHGLALMAHAADGRLAQHWIELGVDAVAVASVTRIVMDAARELRRSILGDPELEAPARATY